MNGNLPCSLGTYAPGTTGSVGAGALCLEVHCTPERKVEPTGRMSMLVHVDK